MDMNFGQTANGNPIIEFEDCQLEACSIEKSESRGQDVYWLGRNGTRMCLDFRDIERLHAITRVILKTGVFPTQDRYEDALDGTI